MAGTVTPEEDRGAARKTQALAAHRHRPGAALAAHRPEAALATLPLGGGPLGSGPLGTGAGLTDGAGHTREQAPDVAPGLEGERHIARVLRVGAVTSGSMFLASVALDAMPQTHLVSVVVDGLRKGGASLLLVTPVARLLVAGGLLGARGEWRYALYAVGVLGLMGLAVGAGLAG